MSISGISAILVGIYACIGTGLVYFILNKQDSFDTLFNIPLLNINTTYQLASICLIALGVLAISLLCFSLIWQQYYGLTSSIMLIFYGLSLVNCSKYTYSDIRYLGYAEILLGLVDSFTITHALLFWVTGFGLLHIVAGIYFYCKVEHKQHPARP